MRLFSTIGSWETLFLFWCLVLGKLYLDTGSIKTRFVDISRKNFIQSSNKPKVKDFLKDWMKLFRAEIRTSNFKWEVQINWQAKSTS